MYRYNPFRPNGLVPPGVFTGRVEESQALEQMLFQTKNGNPHNFLLHGERGIGKSSLMYVHQLTAAGKMTGWGDAHFSFLVVNAILEPTDDYQSIIRKLGAGLNRAISAHQKAKELIKTAWDFIKRVEIMGVKYQSAGEANVSPSELLDELVQSYVSAGTEIDGAFDGILIQIDEADKPPAEAHLGSLMKGFTERLSRGQYNRVAIGLAGVSSVLKALQESHESALRVFTTFYLKPLSWEESVEVVRRGLRDATETNAFETRVTAEAESLIAMYSEGYPHFVQQFAYCAFEADKDREIDRADVLEGAWGEHGAFEQLGTKYFEGLFFDQINSDDYRQVLRFMAERLDEWVSKEEIRKSVSLKETTLSNALQALKKRRIILPKPGQQGTYRLPMKSFAAWIKAYTAGPEPPPLGPPSAPPG